MSGYNRSASASASVRASASMSIFRLVFQSVSLSDRSMSVSDGCLTGLRLADLCLSVRYLTGLRLADLDLTGLGLAGLCFCLCLTGYRLTSVCVTSQCVTGSFSTKSMSKPSASGRFMSYRSMSDKSGSDRSVSDGSFSDRSVPAPSVYYRSVSNKSGSDRSVSVSLCDRSVFGSVFYACLSVYVCDCVCLGLYLTSGCLFLTRVCLTGLCLVELFDWSVFVRCLSDSSLSELCVSFGCV